MDSGRAVLQNGIINDEKVRFLHFSHAVFVAVFSNQNYMASKLSVFL